MAPRMLVAAAFSLLWAGWVAADPSPAPSVGLPAESDVSFEEVPPLPEQVSAPAADKPGDSAKKDKTLVGDPLADNVARGVGDIVRYASLLGPAQSSDEKTAQGSQRKEGRRLASAAKHSSSSERPAETQRAAWLDRIFDQSGEPGSGSSVNAQQ